MPEDYKAIEKNDASLNQQTPKRSCYQKGNLCEHIGFFCSLAAASYVGVLSRIYLSKLANWNGVPLFPSLIPQMVGTVLMGFVISHKTLLATTRPFLYQAITTGLCGSITTFSSWNSEAVSTLLQTGQVPPDNLVRVFGWLTTLLLGLGMSVGALTVGQHLALLSPWSNSNLSKREDREAFSGNLECCVSFLLWLILTVLVVAIPYTLSRYDLLFSSLFASFGTYLRWHLAPLNSVFSNFKLGTFLVNVVGAWILGGVVAAQHHIHANSGTIVQDVLAGVGAGFCGCLTTVSTLAVELCTLPLGASYLYALFSILVAQVGMILVQGTLQWSME